MVTNCKGDWVQAFQPLRQTAQKPAYGSKDVLVVFGEVFTRGYVNGLIDEAKKPA